MKTAAAIAVIACLTVGVLLAAFALVSGEMSTPTHPEVWRVLVTDSDPCRAEPVAQPDRADAGTGLQGALRVADPLVADPPTRSRSTAPGPISRHC